jgi:transcriptional regulator with XRE-family HTH domain
MSFDYSKLCGKIKEKCKTQERFAKLMGIARTSLSAKLNNNSEFTQQEINKAIEVLNLTQSEIPEYFFREKVQKNEQNIL